MFRILFAMLLLLVGGCARPQPAGDASVDIERAAARAQRTVDAYSEHLAAERPAVARAKPLVAREDTPATRD